MEEFPRIDDNRSEMGQILDELFLVFGFGWRSLKRHRILITLVFGMVIVLSITVIRVMPRTFDCRSRIIMNPSRTLINVAPIEGRSSAAELLKSQEIRSEVVDETDLVNRWKNTRSTIGRFKDSMLRKLSETKNPAVEEKELKQMLAYMLGNKVQVWVENNVLQIIVEWHDAETAFLITQALVNRFMEDQYQRENAENVVKIASAEKRLVLAEERLKLAETRYKQTLIGERLPIKQDATSRTTRESEIIPAESFESTTLEADLVELERELALKTDEARRLENTYLERLDNAKTNLAELKLTMGPRHPDVIQAERLVSILSSPPPELQRLNFERESLSARLEKNRAKDESVAASPTRRRRKTSETGPPVTSITAGNEPSELELNFDEYQFAREERNRIAGDLSYARIEAQAGKAAFDYRFKVSQPPVLPVAPSKPKPTVILAAAIVAGLFLGIFLAIVVDIRSGIIFESWQVSRILRIPVLGQMDEL